MTFGQAIKSGFSNYVNFSDRAARSEYWYWVLFTVVVTVVARGLDATVGMRVLYLLWGLAVALPGIAVGIRRLHDLDRSGWWLFLGLVPLVGSIILLVWFCTAGTAGSNRFGPDPLAGTPQFNPRPAT